MNYLEYLSVWNKLSHEHRHRLQSCCTTKKFRKGEILHNGSNDCTGLFLILSGKLRAYILSSDGREITIYSLFERDICLLSASCIMNSIRFDITIEAEKDTEVIIIPSEVYKSVMQESAPLANYTNEIMASRFTDVMWLIDQIMWQSFDKRLANFLLSEALTEENDTLKITHETIGKHLGSPREVVTRMLKYFQNEGVVKLSRGMIEITDKHKLESLADE